MKKLLYKSIILIATANLSFASITLSGGQVRTQQDENGIAVSAGRLFVVVLDSGRDGFGDILDQASISLNNPIDANGNDLVLRIGSTAVAGPLGVISQGSTTQNFDADFLNLSPSNPSNVAVYWFSGLDSTARTLTLGDAYGVARNADWFVDDPNDSPVLSNVDAAGPANLRVLAAVVPEPASMSLLGLGALGMIARRRRG